MKINNSIDKIKYFLKYGKYVNSTNYFWQKFLAFFVFPIQSLVEIKTHLKEYDKLLEPILFNLERITKMESASLQDELFGETIDSINHILKNQTMQLFFSWARSYVRDLLSLEMMDDLTNGLKISELMCGSEEFNQIEFDALLKIVNKCTEEKSTHHLFFSFLQTLKHNLILSRESNLPLAREHLTIELNYKKLVQGPFLFSQLKLGGGMCYGFAFSMCDSDLSPYKNNSSDTLFKQTIADYQKDQLYREKDQQRIKKTRITVKQFCPSIKKQAEVLYEVASKHVGDELMVLFSLHPGGHVTYLCKQIDNKIRYADSNHGVFLFASKEQFISAYRLMYLYQDRFMSPKGYYSFFSVMKLVEDKNGELKESKSWAGKWRSFLMGDKYDQTPNFMLLSILRTIAGFGGFIFGLIGGLLLCAFLFLNAVTVVSLNVFIVLTTCIAGIVLGDFVGELIEERIKHFYGLLGPYHYIREVWHVFTESVKASFGIRRECDEMPDMSFFPLETSYVKMVTCGVQESEFSAISTDKTVYADLFPTLPTPADTLQVSAADSSIRLEMD